MRPIGCMQNRVAKLSFFPPFTYLSSQDGGGSLSEARLLPAFISSLASDIACITQTESCFFDRRQHASLSVLAGSEDRGAPARHGAQRDGEQQYRNISNVRAEVVCETDWGGECRRGDE